jgi:hypothetical protein
LPSKLAPDLTASLRPQMTAARRRRRCHKGRIGDRLRCATARRQRAARKSYRYQWTEAGRSILAEDVKNEIYHGATPNSAYVRGVIEG